MNQKDNYMAPKTLEKRIEDAYLMKEKGLSNREVLAYTGIKNHVIQKFVKDRIKTVICNIPYSFEINARTIPRRISLILNEEKTDATALNAVDILLLLKQAMLELEDFLSIDSRDYIFHFISSVHLQTYHWTGQSFMELSPNMNAA